MFVPLPTADNAFSRRRFLHIGGLSLLGLSTAELTRLRAQTAAGSPAAKHRYNSCVFVFLFGGPSHIDLWDMKPDAPLEVRGEFTGTETNVPGIRLCEHLPLLAQQMDKFCLLRSMTHRMNVHGPACSEIFTGRPYPFPPTTDQTRPEDFPSMSALAMRYAESRGGLPSSIVLPWYLQFPGQSRPIAGQFGGRMGRHYTAMVVEGDPGKDDFQQRGFLPAADVPMQRLARRRDLLDNLDALSAADLRSEQPVALMAGQRRRAYTLLENQAGEAFDLQREPSKLRERYGRAKIAQSFLLARRLVEAGVSLVTVNWEDETKIDGVNTCWDTHQQNFPKLKNLLCPMFDQCFSAFLTDLHDRGLLETTLVVAVGEFGRTPRIGEVTQSNNTQSTGRDHWPHAFTALLAGGGVRGGQAYGATTKNGGYVADRPVTPADLTATIFYHLGVDINQHYFDNFQNVPQRLCEGQAVRDLG